MGDRHAFQWESTDEAYDEGGKQVNAEEVQEAIMSSFKQLYTQLP